MNELLEVIIEPFRFLWEVLPPTLSIPLFLFMLLIFAAYMADIEQLVGDSESVPNSGFDPERGYKYNPEDFE